MAIDQDNALISVRWAAMPEEFFTIGFRVWNKWSVPLDKDNFGVLHLFDVVLENDKPYCSDSQPVFNPAKKDLTVHVTDNASQIPLVIDKTELDGLPTKCVLETVV